MRWTLFRSAGSLWTLVRVGLEESLGQLLVRPRRDARDAAKRASTEFGLARGQFLFVHLAEEGPPQKEFKPKDAKRVHVILD